MKYPTTYYRITNEFVENRVAKVIHYKDGLFGVYCDNGYMFGLYKDLKSWLKSNNAVKIKKQELVLLD